MRSSLSRGESKSDEKISRLGVLTHLSARTAVCPQGVFASVGVSSYISITWVAENEVSLSSLQRFPNKCRGAFTSGRLSLSATTEASEKHGNPELHKKHILLASANEVISTQQLSCQQLCRVFAAQTSWGSKNKPWAEFPKTRTIKKKWRHRRCESETQRALDELPVSVCHRYKVSPTPATEEVSHSYSPAVCRLQTRGAVEWQACGRDQISFWNFNLLQLNYLISEPPTSKGIPQLPPSCLPWWSFSIQLPESLTRLISAPCGLKAEIGDVQH